MDSSSRSAPYRDLLMGTVVLAAAATLLHWPKESISSVQEGLSLCGNILIPSLFPFFVLSNLVVELGISRYLGKWMAPLMQPIFHLSGHCSCALILGFIGGYPIGARTAISLYQNGQCSKTECERLLAFCNNSGPAFIFGVVGAGIFQNTSIGLLLYLTHIAASLLVGFLFRFYKYTHIPPSSKSNWNIQAVPFSTAFTRSITNSLTSVLNICAFVLFFTVFLRCLFLSGILPFLTHILSTLLTPVGLSSRLIQSLITGMIELSSGISALTQTGSLSVQIPLAAFMLGWAGFSVHSQVVSFLSQCDLSPKTYLTGKLLHGIFSAILTQAALNHLPISQNCFTQKSVSGASINFFTSLSHALLYTLGACSLFFFLTIYAAKKRCGKERRCAL